MIKSILSLCTLFVFLCFFQPPAQAATFDAQNYRRAFALLDSGYADQANIFAIRGRDPILNKVIRSAYMAHPGNDISFSEMADFISSEPDWPNLRGILAIAEQKIPANASSEQIINWFNLHSPVTIVGFYRYIDAENELGQTDAVAEQIRNRWTDGDFSNSELAAFYSRFPMFIGPHEIWARLDHLLWKNDISGVHALFPYADNDMKAVAEARMALANQSRHALSLADDVPSAWTNNPGLLYEKLRWYRKNNDDQYADKILLNAPHELGDPDAWWEERQIMVRRAIEQHNYKLAYNLAANHGLTNPKKAVQAEFLAGWLALRFLNNPEEAHPHFQTLYEISTTPVSRARGAYWLARSEEALGDQDTAQQDYENAAALNMTYYGQLAAVRIYNRPTVRATPEPPIPATVRNQFYSRDTIQAAEKLYALGERDRARNFFNAAKDFANQRAEFALLTELAYKIERPDLAIETAKTANQKNFMITAGGYPILTLRMPTPPETAFTHAVIRQESMFNSTAGSGAGAKGLMQLMPATAKSVAKKLGVRYSESRLYDPNYSLRLGTAFMEAQIDDFNGSYILALAGYNAGPHRVREWLSEIGDPRDESIDPIDWVELIPVQETRNYVQRIIENLQIYRARLNGGQAPLLILKDLRR